MKKIVYYRVINTKPYVLMQFNGISIIDINKFLCSIGFSKKQIWIYREIPYYNDGLYVPFSKLKPQHTARKKISFDHIVSATDCIAVGDENPLLGYGLDDIIEKKIDITKETCFFA